MDNIYYKFTFRYYPDKGFETGPDRVPIWPPMVIHLRVRVLAKDYYGSRNLFKFHTGQLPWIPEGIVGTNQMDVNCSLYITSDEHKQIQELIDNPNLAVICVKSDVKLLVDISKLIIHGCKLVKDET